MESKRNDKFKTPTDQRSTFRPEDLAPPDPHQSSLPETPFLSLSTSATPDSTGTDTSSYQHDFPRTPYSSPTPDSTDIDVSTTASSTTPPSLLTRHPFTPATPSPEERGGSDVDMYALLSGATSTKQGGKRPRSPGAEPESQSPTDKKTPLNPRLTPPMPGYSAPTPWTPSSSEGEFSPSPATPTKPEFKAPTAAATRLPFNSPGFQPAKAKPTAAIRFPFNSPGPQKRTKAAVATKPSEQNGHPPVSQVAGTMFSKKPGTKGRRRPETRRPTRSHS